MNAIIHLPWPPSVNAVYRSFAFVSKFQRRPMSRIIISKEGRDYFDVVANIIKKTNPHKFGTARLKVEIFCYPKDKRKRDLGNLDKVLMDALEKAGVYDNDSQIDKQTFVRGGICKNGGNVVIYLTEIVIPVPIPCPCPVCASTDLFNDKLLASKGKPHSPSGCF